MKQTNPWPTCQKCGHQTEVGDPVTNNLGTNTYVRCTHCDNAGHIDRWYGIQGGIRADREFNLVAHNMNEVADEGLTLNLYHVLCMLYGDVPECQ